jgi:hypothetical protein
MSPINHQGAESAIAACTSTRCTKLKVVRKTPTTSTDQRATTTTARRVVGTTEILARVGND